MLQLCLCCCLVELHNHVDAKKCKSGKVGYTLCDYAAAFCLCFSPEVLLLWPNGDDATAAVNCVWWNVVTKIQQVMLFRCVFLYIMILCTEQSLCCNFSTPYA